MALDLYELSKIHVIKKIYILIHIDCFYIIELYKQGRILDLSVISKHIYSNNRHFRKPGIRGKKLCFCFA